MAKTYITTDNSRYNTVTAASPHFAHIRGWNAGVEVRASGKDGNTWRVYMTAGSSGTTDTVFLGEVSLSDKGRPVWKTARRLANALRGK